MNTDSQRKAIVIQTKYANGQIPLYEGTVSHPTGGALSFTFNKKELMSYSDLLREIMSGTLAFPQEQYLLFPVHHNRSQVDPLGACFFQLFPHIMRGLSAEERAHRLYHPVSWVNMPTEERHSDFQLVVIQPGWKFIPRERHSTVEPRQVPSYHETFMNKLDREDQRTIGVVSVYADNALDTFALLPSDGRKREDLLLVL